MQHKFFKGGFLLIIMTINITFSEIELAEDVQALVSLGSKQACEDTTLKNKIMAFDNDCLLSVQKTIASPIKIIGVEEVTEDMIKAAL